MRKQFSAYPIAMMGMLFAVAMVLSYIEGLLPAMPQGIKLGLSNIVTMYALFFLNKSSAITLAVLKSLFVMLTRGVVAGCMSMGGGLCSIAIMILLLSFKKKPLSYLMISVAGAIFHNIGQLIIAAFIIHSTFVLYYFPVMLISGIVMGSATGISLRVMLPYVKRIARK